MSAADSRSPKAPSGEGFTPKAMQCADCSAWINDGDGHFCSRSQAAPSEEGMPAYVTEAIARARRPRYATDIGDDAAIRYLADELSQLSHKRDIPMCNVCLGNGRPLSGKPCICGGIGTEQAELDGLRRRVFALEDENDRLHRDRQQDTERLDWLQGDNNAKVGPTFHRATGNFGCLVEAHGQRAWGFTLREAIDAARSSSTPAGDQ